VTGSAAGLRWPSGGFILFFRGALPAQPAARRRPHRAAGGFAREADGRAFGAPVLVSNVPAAAGKNTFACDTGR